MSVNILVLSSTSSSGGVGTGPHASGGCGGSSAATGSCGVPSRSVWIGGGGPVVLVVWWLAQQMVQDMDLVPQALGVLSYIDSAVCNCGYLEHSFWNGFQLCCLHCCRCFYPNFQQH